MHKTDLIRQKIRLKMNGNIQVRKTHPIQSKPSLRASSRPAKVNGLFEDGLDPSVSVGLSLM